MGADDVETGEGGPQHERRGPVEEATGTQAELASTSAGVEAADAALPEKPLEGRALVYLSELLKNIEWMLTYANNNGIVLPDELREQIDDLYRHPSVEVQTTDPNSNKERYKGPPSEVQTSGLSSNKKNGVRRWLPEFLR